MLSNRIAVEGDLVSSKRSCYFVTCLLEISYGEGFGQ
jgi:hypothetical protein